jgi:ring-1,2-phenylacetyl-CoA epoxidase subunit PaaD
MVKELLSLSTEELWEILNTVTDPEIPVVSVVEMGMIRSVAVEGERVTVVMTPTFAGCPAIGMMREEIETRLRQAGAAEVQVRAVHAPPWSSDWITPEAREKLRQFGLAPPPRHGGQVKEALAAPVVCPYCGSANTGLRNDFGPTLCRAIYVCNQCRQPFEGFKPL